MIIAKTTQKGHVIIPAALRKKYNIKKGTKVAISEGEGNVILIKPMPEDPIEASRGMLKGKTSMIEQLPVTIVNADMEITVEAARLKSAHSVVYADCFAAALGIRKKAKVITGDPEFKQFGETVKIEWL